MAKSGKSESRIPAGLVPRVLARFGIGFASIGAMLFVTAGSLAWWNAWLYLGTFFLLLLASFFLLLVRDPALLERRTRTKEREKTQKAVVWPFLALILALFIIPGLDRRLGWSSVPAWVVAVGTVVLCAAYALLVAVLRANSWASRVVEVNEGQRVIDTGPYAIVRHPMYLASIVIYLATPLVLGSWWALVPAILLMPFYQIRLANEEKVLGRELPGYAAYLAKVKWRIIPGLW